MDTQRFNTFATTYRQALELCMLRSPDDYGIATEWTADQVAAEAATVANKILTTVRTGHLGRVAINTAAFRYTAKRLGTRPTYKALTAYLNGE